MSLETAGNIDLDVEIKFTLGSTHFSLDVHKKHLEELKDLYKSLLKIGQIAQDNLTVLEFSKQSLQIASSTLNRNHSTEVHLATEFKEINETAFNWLLENQKKYIVRDFSHVFELYINN